MLVRKMYDCFRQGGEIVGDKVPTVIQKSLTDMGYTQKVDKEFHASLVGLSKLAKNCTYEQFAKNFEDELPALKLSADQMERLKGGKFSMPSGSNTCEGRGPFDR